MTREIKFRARNANLPLCWIYGYFVIEKGCCYIINDDGKFKIIAGTEGQYTGLSDKHDKKAFQKDLISASGYSNWIIEWHKDGWYMKTTNIDEKYYHKIPDDFIIIGNFYENHDLLENK